MVYTLDFVFDLGDDLSGLTLNGQLIDTSAGDVGAAITTGFTEIANGKYLLNLTTVPDGHRGGIKVYESGDTRILSAAAINPEEAENVDVKVSTRSSHTAAAVWEVVLEGTYTAKQIMRLNSAVLAGVASGMGGVTGRFYALGSLTKNRVQATIDVDGNRSGLVYNVTDLP